MMKPICKVLLRGIAGPEPDLSAARIYASGVLGAEVSVSSGQTFTAAIAARSAGPLLIEHSFINQRGEESPRFQQTVIIPNRGGN